MLNIESKDELFRHIHYACTISQESPMQRYDFVRCSHTPRRGSMILDMLSFKYSQYKLNGVLKTNYRNDGIKLNALFNIWPD